METIGLNCLVFDKIAFLHFGIKIQDGGSLRISAILDFRVPIMASLKRPCTISYRSSIALICLVFEKIGFFAVWRQTNRWTASMH